MRAAWTSWWSSADEARAGVRDRQSASPVRRAVRAGGRSRAAVVQSRAPGDQRPPGPYRHAAIASCAPASSPRAYEITAKGTSTKSVPTFHRAETIFDPFFTTRDPGRARAWVAISRSTRWLRLLPRGVPRAPASAFSRSMFSGTGRIYRRVADLVDPSIKTLRQILTGKMADASPAVKLQAAKDVLE